MEIEALSTITADNYVYFLGGRGAGGDVSRVSRLSMEKIGDLSSFEDFGRLKEPRCLHKCILLDLEGLIYPKGQLLIIGGSEKKFIEKFDLLKGENVNEDFTEMETKIKSVTFVRNQLLKNSCIA